MQHRDRRALGALSALALLAATASGAAAQEQFTDQKVESFVDAAVAVEDLVNEWQPKIQQAQDESQAEEMRQQANLELAQAVEDTAGISVEEYMAIGQEARQDPELAARIQDIYQAQAGTTAQ